MGDTFLPKDKRTKQHEIVALAFDPEIEKIKCYRRLSPTFGELFYVCPFRLTSKKADCYVKIRDGQEGVTLWSK